MNQKLYYKDPYIKTFTSPIMKQGQDEKGNRYVVLENTAFYPTGGGQPCDTGTINELGVTAVEEVDDEIRHYINEFPPDENKEMTGKIDWERRFDHMQQHCGQHILSRAFENLFDINTIGFHLGKETITIDLEIEELTSEMESQAETLANQIVFENREIKTRWVKYEDFKNLPLRKMPSVRENIRLVIIDKFDYNGCGGTHPKRTGEVGPIKILNRERHKRKVRLQFVCGWRTINILGQKQTMLQETGQLLSSPEDELPTHVERLLESQKTLEKSFAETNETLLEYEANELLLRKNQSNVVTATFDGRSIKELQKLARKVIGENQDVVTLLVTTNEEKLQFVCGRGDNRQINMNDMVKQIFPIIDGKGGGNKSFAQGGGKSLISAEELIDQLLQIVQNR